MLTLDMLKKLWPEGNDKMPGLIEGILEKSESVFQKYGISSELLVAHVMAQISHECGAGTDIVENLNYSAERMMQVWPSRFPTLQDAQPYAHSPMTLANKVYNGRMGNAVGSNDGWNFRGRGATQTTGKEGYSLLAAKMGLPLLMNPDLVNTPEYFLECGVADFIICGCLPYAKNDDILGVTKRLNGGIVGLDQRKQWLFRWKQTLAADRGTLPPSPFPDIMETVTPMSGSKVVSQPKIRQNVFRSFLSLFKRK
jgi:putative chitinase